MVYLGAQVKRFPGNAQTTGSGAARFATKTVPTIEAYTQRLWIPNLALLGARRHQADNSADVWHPTSRADSEVSLGQDMVQGFILSGIGLEMARTTADTLKS